MPRWARKKDRNHNQMVEAFQTLGFSVMEIYRAPKCVDLVVAKCGRTWLVEVKEPGEKLTGDQAAILRAWQGPTAVVSTVDDVLAVHAQLG